MQKLAIAFGMLACASVATAAVDAVQTARLKSSAAIVRDIEMMIPGDYWSRARCIVVVPEVKKAAFIFGGEYGKGVMSCRAGDGWSAPLFVQLAKGSWGFQAGAQQVDLVLLVMNEGGVDKLLQTKVTLGADASVAAGPLGRQAAAATDAQLRAEILSYSRAQGLFAGLDLSGGVLRPDRDANKEVYGARASPRTILASREISAPTEATPLLNALAAGPSSPPAGAPASTAARPSASRAAPSTAGASPAGAEDLRARLMQMRQNLDRMLSDAGPVGTTGTTADATTTEGRITVDRARLMQLRDQIDSMLTELNRRQ